MQPKFTLRSLGRFRKKVFAFALIFLSATTFSHSQALINESFNTVVPLPTGWAQQNLSSPAGAGTWFQGNPANFPANSGATNAYASVNFASGSGTSTLSNWLLTPTVSIVTGSTFSFFTRTVTGNIFPDRLQVRMSLAGTSVNVGATATSVGDFTTLLQDVNPTYTNAYPEVWTKITINITGVAVPTNGRFAFRYFVENGGPAGDNSNLIGIDDVLFTGPCTPTNATAPVISSVPSTTCAGSPITLNVISGSLNGAANWVWYSGSVSTPSIGTGNSITVSPVANTTYFARGEGGCAPAPGASGSQLVTVTPCTCISPDLATICVGSIQRLRVNGTGAPASSGVTSGAITVAIPDGSAVGATHTIPVSLPAGATLTGVTANFNITHTWDSDLQINLKAPNGQVLNLVNSRGGSGDNFTNTSISSASTTSLATGTPPFTGTFAADATMNVGPTGFVSSTTSFPALYTVPNGNWTIAMRDNVGFDVGTLTSWTLTFNYTLDPTGLWTGPAGTIFTDPAATIPYVTGTQANVVWTKPTTTGANTYTATLASGPCAGANNITVNVLAVPTVTVSPNPGGCSPATLTASGASVYNWSPSIGLNTTNAATVIATTPVNATYTVLGVGANGCAAAPVTVAVTGAPTSSVISSLGAPPTVLINEGFEGTTLPSGWAQQNLSNPIGSVPNWLMAPTLLSPAQNGTPNSYIMGNFNNVGGANTISNWLFTPATSIANGDQLTFYTRTVSSPAFPDRLQVRMSTNGSSVNAGSSEVSVGDFTNLVLDINPSLTTSGYPNVWTQFTYTVSGLSAPVTGRFAFRYFVEDGGPAGNNSDNVGIDNVQLQRPALATCANTTSTIKVDITGGMSPYSVVYTNGTTNTTFNGYVSGSPIQVSPGVSTNYTLVSVTSANGCVGIGNSGTAIIDITPPPAITSQPPNRVVCDGQNTTFTVGDSPSIGSTYQWQISTNGGSSYSNLTNGGVYSGAASPVLTITGVTPALNANRYRVVVTGACPPNPVISTGGLLTVNVGPTITSQPVATTKCIGTTATFTVAASGAAGTSTPAYQWEVSTNSGLNYSPISGATAATLTLTNITATMNNNLYRCIVTVPPCSASVTSLARALTVTALPTLTIATPVTQLIPGRVTTLTATSNPGPFTPASFSWTRDGVTVTGATTSSLVLDIDKVGTYRASVTDINGCVGTSNSLIIGTEASDRLWIYPNPTDGVFQVRLYYATPTVSERREVTIWDANGKIVARQISGFIPGMSSYYQMNFDLRGVGAGTYLVKVVEKRTNRIVSGLVVIQ